jgi:predicted nucleic acid-binding protein
MYLLNTDVSFELMKKDPCANVLRWCTHVPCEYLYISVLTIGALKQKIHEVIPLAQCGPLNTWIHSNFLNWFDKNILPIDAKISARWGDLFACNSEGVLEDLLVATAIENNLILVTGSNKCSSYGVKIFNPFI